MKKTIILHTISMSKCMAVTYLFAIVLIGTIHIGDKYIYIRNPVLFGNVLCLALLFTGLYLMKKHVSKVIFTFSPNASSIERESLPRVHVTSSCIISYAIYYCLLKRWGYIFHIKTKQGRFYYYIVPDGVRNVNASDHETFLELHKLMHGMVEQRSKMTFTDWLYIFAFIFIMFVMMPAMGGLIVFYT